MRKYKIVFFFLILVILTGCAGAKTDSVADKNDEEGYAIKTTSEKPNNKPSNKDEGRIISSSESCSEADVAIADISNSVTVNKNVCIIENTGEEYSQFTPNAFQSSEEKPVSTFSIDVDTASYSNIRRYINHQILPPMDAVRIEEMINYFNYDYPVPEDTPVAVTVEIGECPWNSENYLAMIGLQAKSIKEEEMPPSNLVFLIDVSGSMSDENKLPLLKSAFKLLVEELEEKDKVSIVVYAGSSGIVLDSARGNEKEEIIDALDRLQAGGSTAGSEGILLAYKLAHKNYIDGGNNRVILATDGDFNVGLTSEEQLEELIIEKRDEGIYLSVLGFGMGNLKDNKMEILADKGNGNYAYIDNMQEANKVFVSEMQGTLYTVAKDVKIQVEFEQDQVKEYRLIGYENRLLDNEDFEDDRKDAGEIGAGHTVTALYEIVPSAFLDKKQDLMEIRLRYKYPNESLSRLITTTLNGEDIKKKNTESFNFAASVAEFGQILTHSIYTDDSRLEDVYQRVRENISYDNNGYKEEFSTLILEYDELLNEFSSDSPFKYWETDNISSIRITSQLEGKPEHKDIVNRNDIHSFKVLLESLDFRKSNNQENKNGWMLYITTDGETHSMLVAEERAQIDGIWYDIHKNTKSVLVNYFNGL